MIIMKKTRDIVQLFMIRRTDDSAMHGYKVVTLPKIMVEWARFGTPSALAKQIDNYRRQISKEERENTIRHTRSGERPTRTNHWTDRRKNRCRRLILAGKRRSLCDCGSWPTFLA